ncbi:MAG TPA: hypothetical protein QF401_06490 [Candidatus Poseidoniaceae archaeon]|nr:hypothetical protein [Candidatus Poseidoniaceae archaeon]
MAEGMKKRSPWVARLAILGVLFLVTGTILLNSQSETIDSIFDPREISIAEIKGEGSATFDVEEKNCYMAVVLESGTDLEVTLTPIVGSAAASEDLTPKSCFSDWNPMASDGEAFTIQEQWVAEESGEMMASSSCVKDTCEGQTVWLIHTDSTWALKIFESSGMIFGFGICCLGFLFLPIAGILAYSARSKAIHGTFRVVDNDGVLLQSFDNQEDLMAALKDSNSTLHQNAGAQMPEEDIERDDGFVDGSKDVMQGTLLTTEQVYAFMRGDAPERIQEVEDPFADTPKVVRQVEKKTVVNTEEISDWDSGDNGTSVTPNRPVQRKSIQSKEPKSESGDWAVWDDM